MTVTGRLAVLAATVLLCAPLSKAAPSVKVGDPDAYAVYSELMNSATRGHADKGLWMLSDTITSSAADRPCRPDPNAPNGEDSLAWRESPQHSIKPPVADKARLQEVLDDFEKNCHETGSLLAERFKTDWPVRMLTPAETKRFEMDLMPENPKLLLRKWPKGATGLQRYSRVFFNRDHSLAMVRSFFYCGMLCATWEWQVLERTETGWKVLSWPHDVTVS